MQKKTSGLLYLFIVVLFFCSCHSGATYTIKMRLNKGDVFVHNIKMNVAANNAAMNVKINMDMGTSFQVIDSDATSKELQMTYTAMHMSMDMGNPDVSVKSATDSILNKMNNAIVGKPVIIKLSNTNEITDVTGYDSLFNDASIDDATKQNMTKMFSKDQLNQMFGLMFNMYPKNPVRVGESWNSPVDINVAGINMKANIKYTLNGVKDNTADIDVDGVIDGKGNMTNSGATVSMDMTGTEKGSFTVGLDDGYIKTGEYKMDIKADMEMMGQKMPMTMQADYNITGK